MSSTVLPKTRAPWEWKVWWQWVAANAASETVGLGGTLLLGVLLLAKAEPVIGPVPAAALAVLAGTLLEGSLVGTAQWLVLHHPLRGLRWRAWAVATALGACVAWTLGMIPSTFLITGSGSASGCPAVAGLTPPPVQGWLVGACQCARLDAGDGGDLRWHGFHSGAGDHPAGRARAVALCSGRWCSRGSRAWPGFDLAIAHAPPGCNSRRRVNSARLIGLRETGCGTVTTLLVNVATSERRNRWI
jgi:hypothetical protein